MKYNTRIKLALAVIAACVVVHPAQAQRWWTAPVLKARISFPDPGPFNGPHYWNADAGGSLLFVTTGYGHESSEFGYLYEIDAITGSAGEVTNLLPLARGNALDLGPYSYGLRGGAISAERGVVISGNAYEGNKGQYWGHAVLPSTGEAWNRSGTNTPVNVFAVSNDVSVHVVWDSADFSHDGQHLYSNDYLWDVVPGESERIWKWNVGNLAQDGLGLTSNAVYYTQVKGIWSVNVYSIGGRDLIYYGGLDFAESNILVCAFDTVDETEHVLVSIPNTAETNPYYAKSNDFEVLQNVKVSGIAAGRMHLHVTFDDGAIMVYSLRPGGKAAGPKLRHFTPQDVCDILGVGSLWCCRAFEVTDDERFAILASHGQNRIHVIHSHPVETLLMLR